MSKLTAGDKAPELVNVMIEVPLDSRVKYELDHDLDAIAVTRGPGLPGSLVVGMNIAKGLSLGSGLPLIGISHLEGHL